MADTVDTIITQTETEPEHVEDTHYEELPPPPTADASGPSEAPVDGTFDPELLNKHGEKLGDPFPKGTYSFRIDSYTEGWGDEETNPQKEKIKKYGNQPYYMVQLICTQEPLVGKRWGLFCSWCNPKTMKAVGAGDPEALALFRQRMATAKTLMDGLEWKGTNIAKFLESGAEGKFTLGINPKKTRVNGKLVETGEMQNQLLKVMPLYKVGG